MSREEIPEIKMNMTVKALAYGRCLITLTFVLESGLILKPTSVILGLLSEINKLNNSVSEFFVPHAFYSPWFIWKYFH